MLALALGGGVIGAIYGVLHDELTYALSPEYFTRLKFHQFSWANAGLPPRAFAGEIGAIAVGWVGACTGWLLARIAVPVWPMREAVRHTLVGFAITLIFAFSGSLSGCLLGLQRRANPDFSNWESYIVSLGIQDPAAFVHVGYIHNAGYIGGLLGLIVAIAWLMRRRSASRTAPASHGSP